MFSYYCMYCSLKNCSLCTTIFWPMILFFSEHYFGAVHSNDWGLGPMTNMGHGLELSENIKCPKKKKKKRFGFNLLCLIIVTRHCITMATSTERRSSWKSHFSKPCHIESKCFYRELFFFNLSHQSPWLHYVGHTRHAYVVRYRLNLCRQFAELLLFHFKYILFYYFIFITLYGIIWLKIKLHQVTVTSAQLIRANSVSLHVYNTQFHIMNRNVKTFYLGGCCSKQATRGKIDSTWGGMNEKNEHHRRRK